MCVTLCARVSAAVENIIIIIVIILYGVKKRERPRYIIVKSNNPLNIFR